MGNICSCFTNSDSSERTSPNNHHPFSSPGRTLDSTRPAQQDLGTNEASRQMGQEQSSPKQGQGQVLGGSQQPERRETDAEMRAAMARAADARAQDKRPKGKIGQSLDKQQRRTDTGTLQDASSQEVGARRQDEGQTARTWD